MNIRNIIIIINVNQSIELPSQFFFFLEDDTSINPVLISVKHIGTHTVHVMIIAESNLQLYRLKLQLDNMFLPIHLNIKKISIK